MDFFVSDEALGGAGMSRREMRAAVCALSDRLDAEREKRDALLRDLRRVDRDIERWQSLLRDLEAGV